MRVSGAIRARTTETSRTPVRFDGTSEQLFATVLSNVARMLWPDKTSAHIAAAVGCSVRAAEMYLAGDREWSGDALAAIVAEILKRHAMRNMKILKRP